MDSRCSNHCDACPVRFVCHCLKISEEAVLEAVRTLQLRTVKEIRLHTGAGEGCTCCHQRLERFLQDLPIAC